MKAQEKARELFDTVKNHLLTQMEKSVIVDEAGLETCRYRGPSGLTCAFEPLIPKHLYSDDMEGKLASTVINKLSERGYTELNEHKDLCESLQNVHDEHDPDRWEHELGLVHQMYLTPELTE